jgi:hypothetical protein
MLGHNNTGQRTGEVALEVREYDSSIIAGGEQVVRTRGESYAAHFATVHLKQ